MKNNNYNAHKVRSYTIVFGLLILSFSLVFGGLLFRSKLNPDYPLVFTDANNRLMFITKSNNSKNDIASITNANIVYANMDTRYLLYTNNNSLYLLDTTVGGVGKKISNNVVSYGFSLDDKYVYYLDNNSNFFIYNRMKEEIMSIASKVNKIELIRDNNMIYNQEGNLVYQRLDETPVLVSNDYISVELNKENKLILYSVKNESLKDYYVYDIATNNSTKVIEGVTKLYSNNDSYTKFLYTIPASNNKNISNVLKDEYLTSDSSFVSYSYEDYTSKRVSKAVYEENQKLQKDIEFRDQLRAYLKEYGKFGSDLYYKNNNADSLVASNMNELYYYDIKNQIYSYTSYSFENNALDINNYKVQDDVETFYNDIENEKLNSMYFKFGSNSSMAYKNITTNAKVKLRGNSEYYLLVESDNHYNMYYSKINNKSIKMVGEIDTHLLSSNLKTDYQEGYLYINYSNNKYYLNLVSEGRIRVLVEDVNPNHYVVSESKDSIYYLKNTGDYVNDLNIYNGIRTSTIASDIYSFMYINNDLIYVTKNFDSITKTSDLYRLDGNHLTLIYKDIADWYSPLKDDIEEPKEEQV
ncbi:MAG: hypothetical protein IJ572_03150 [Bacilli bacterium]|nr:hypothetical protein [Bacilli bacterium]